MPCVFDYTDYRLFLKDFYLESKQKNPGFSYRYIAAKVGFRSAGHFTQILNGKANLSQNLLSGFIEFLGLSKKEADYFEQLVLFNQAKTQAARQRHLERLGSHSQTTPRLLNPDEYEFYGKWHFSAVRDILSFCRFKGNYQELARLVEPAISPAEARKAVELLKRLGMIVKDDEGVYHPKDVKLSVRTVGTQVGLGAYALAMMDKAKESLDRQSKDERSISWVGFSASQKAFKEITDELREFRRRVLSIVEKDEHPDRAWHFGMQVFPVSKQGGADAEGADK